MASPSATNRSQSCIDSNPCADIQYAYMAISLKSFLKMFRCTTKSKLCVLTVFLIASLSAKTAFACACCYPDPPGERDTSPYSILGLGAAQQTYFFESNQLLDKPIFGNLSTDGLMDPVVGFDKPLFTVTYKGNGQWRWMLKQGNKTLQFNFQSKPSKQWLQTVTIMQTNNASGDYMRRRVQISGTLNIVTDTVGLLAQNSSNEKRAMTATLDLEGVGSVCDVTFTRAIVKLNTRNTKQLLSLSGSAKIPN